MKILVLTDSLGLPRDAPQDLSYEETWPFFLSQQKNVKLLQSSIGGGTSFDLYKQTIYLKSFNPDIVILQVGIVDCAPRALSYHENIIYNNWWITRKILGQVIPRWGNTIRKIRNIRFVNKEEFRINLKRIVELLPNIKIYAIGIIPASIEYENFLPNITISIKEYNYILKEIFPETYIDTFELDQQYVMTDHHHPNKKGHKLIFEIIMNRLHNEF